MVIDGDCLRTGRVYNRYEHDHGAGLVEEIVVYGGYLVRAVSIPICNADADTDADATDDSCSSEGSILNTTSNPNIPFPPATIQFPLPSEIRILPSVAEARLP